MACSSGCPTPGEHRSFGECLRAKGLQIDKHSLANSSRADARWTRSMEGYRELREAGSQPTSPLPHHVEHATRVAMKHGVFRDDS